LAGIAQLTFVTNSDNDIMKPTKNSRLLAEHLPNAHLRIYPDVGHSFLDQYLELFTDHLTALLNGSPVKRTHHSSAGRSRTSGPLTWAYTTGQAGCDSNSYKITHEYNHTLYHVSHHD
jgi:hypothetical protein